ncbi:hypothetical protein [Xanthomonas campestris]|uniref:hypothetical protein n=1 Tax=Xanthomonas campestris TaxID=339 RepID=UPI0039C018B5
MAVAFEMLVNGIQRCYMADGEALSALVAWLGLRRKDRAGRELELMEHLTPVLERLAQGREIAGLSAYAN